MSNLRKILGAVVAASAIVMTAGAQAQEVKHYRFAYDQPKTTGYGIVGDIFADKLKALSKGTMLIEQYPGAQLGQEPQVLQLVKAGDADREHHVPGLWRPDRAHAVRQRLYIAADRRGRCRRKRRQRLSRQQALRSGAGAFDDRARGQQQPGLGQRQ